MSNEQLGRLERRLLRQVGRAIGDFSLIEEGDRVLVAVSGGKDSYTLLHALIRLQQRAPVAFEIEAANLDPGWPDHDSEAIRRFVEEKMQVRVHTVRAAIDELAARQLAPGESPCPLCSRIRRGTLYTLCRREGLNKLALGHHLDDAIETLLLNLFFSGALRSMPPLLERDGPPRVIRPLCYVPEREIVAFAAAMRFPVVSCSARCPGDGTIRDQQREVIKRWLTELERHHPRLKQSARRALANVDPAFLFTAAATRDGRQGHANHPAAAPPESHGGSVATKQASDFRPRSSGRSSK